MASQNFSLPQNVKNQIQAFDNQYRGYSAAAHAMYEQGQSTLSRTATSKLYETAAKAVQYAAGHMNLGIVPVAHTAEKFEIANRKAHQFSLESQNAAINSTALKLHTPNPNTYASQRTVVMQTYQTVLDMAAVDTRVIP